jgi:hypothetical protein
MSRMRRTGSHAAPACETSCPGYFLMRFAIVVVPPCGDVVNHRSDDDKPLRKGAPKR